MDTASLAAAFSQLSTTPVQAEASVRVARKAQEASAAAGEAAARLIEAAAQQPPPVRVRAPEETGRVVDTYA